MLVIVVLADYYVNLMLAFQGESLKIIYL